MSIAKQRSLRRRDHILLFQCLKTASNGLQKDLFFFCLSVHDSLRHLVIRSIAADVQCRILVGAHKIHNHGLEQLRRLAYVLII